DRFNLLAESGRPMTADARIRAEYRKSKRRCSNCYQSGHNASRCPQLCTDKALTAAISAGDDAATDTNFALSRYFFTQIELLFDSIDQGCSTDIIEASFKLTDPDDWRRNYAPDAAASAESPAAECPATPLLPRTSSSAWSDGPSYLLFMDLIRESQPSTSHAGGRLCGPRTRS
ncbi:hypothetical protein OC845_005943, partial [Tilletia horrida]